MGPLDNSGPPQAAQEDMESAHPTIQISRGASSKPRSPQVPARLKPDLQGPLTDRAIPPPQIRPPQDHLANLHVDNILYDHFTTILTESNSIIDGITNTVHHRTATIHQHVANEGPDFSPYVFTFDHSEGEGAPDDTEAPFPSEPMNSPHQHIRSTGFARQEFEGLYVFDRDDRWARPYNQPSPHQDFSSMKSLRQAQTTKTSFRRYPKQSPTLMEW